MPTIGLRLDPLDTLFFRDGRPFDPATRASGQLPYPQPLAGAIRTALLARDGFDFTDFAARRKSNPTIAERQILEDMKAPVAILNLRFRGPWLAVWDKEKKQIEPLLPVPANLARDDKTKKWYRADPLNTDLPGWNDPQGLRPLWRKEGRDAKHPGGFLTRDGINRFLAGSLPQGEDWFKENEDWFKPEALYGFDHRTGIAIDPNVLTAEEGQIYTISLLALRQRIERAGVFQGKEICLYAEVIGELPGDMPRLVPLGGEGRYVQVESTRPACQWPCVENASRTLLYLATPAFFPAWRSVPEVANLIAAASGSPVAFSGWDVARGGPKPTRFAVPAGSVYFVEGHFDPPHQSLCVDVDDNIAQGWGFVLRGTWNYA
jgi:CRISPR-associated protein Cmr3